jgi:hypothetical protein
MPNATGRYYKVEVLGFDEAGKYLDSSYSIGWRVTHMAAHPDGNRAIFLLEKPKGQKPT